MMKFNKTKLVGIVAAASMLVGLVGVTASAQDTQPEQDSETASQAQQASAKPSENQTQQGTPSSGQNQQTSKSNVQGSQPSAQSDDDWNPLLRAYAKYEVRFDLDGGTVEVGDIHQFDEQTVEPGQRAKEPRGFLAKSDTYDNWVSDGWTVSSSDDDTIPVGSEFSFSHPVNGDLVLKAHYTEVGGLSPMPVSQVTVGYPYECAVNPGANTVEGYDGYIADPVLGFWTADREKNRPNFDNTLYRGQWSNANHYNFGPYGNPVALKQALSRYGCTRLYRVIFNLSPNTSVSFDDDLSFGGSRFDAVLHKGDKVSRPSPDPWDNGHIFKGWYTSYYCSHSSCASQNHEFDFNAPIERDTEIEAGWDTRANYKMSFDLNVQPGEDPVSNASAFATQQTGDTWQQDKVFTIPPDVPVRPVPGADDAYFWKFNGWRLTHPDEHYELVSTKLYKPGDSIPLDAGLQTALLTAQWTKLDNYTLSFDPNAPGGAQTTPASVASVVKPWNGDRRVMGFDGTEKLSLDGYTFLGWSKVKNSGHVDYKPCDPGNCNVSVTLTPANPVVTLYGVWSRERTHTLQLDYNAGGDTSLQPSCSTDEDGDPVAGGVDCALPQQTTVARNSEDVTDMRVPSSRLMRSGFTFVGWTQAADGSGPVINPGDTVPVGAHVDPVDEVNLQDSQVTLYAKWIPDTQYSLSFARGVGNVTTGFDTLTAHTSHSGKKIAIPVTNRYGDDDTNTHRFTGWKDEATGKSYQPGDKVSMTSANRNVVLTAQWDSLYTYTLHIVTNRGGARMDTPLEDVTKLTTDDTATLKVPSDYTAGMKDDADRYEFAGWRDNSGTAYDPGQSVALTKDHTSVTLNAQWKKIYDYRLSFDMNAGNDTVSPAQVADMTESTTDQTYRFEMPSVLPTRVSADSTYTWKFVGWSTARDGSGSAPVSGLVGQSSLTLQSDKPSAVLYAQWAKILVPATQLPSTPSPVVVPGASGIPSKPGTSTTPATPTVPSAPATALAPVVSPVTPSVIVPSTSEPTQPEQASSAPSTSQNAPAPQSAYQPAQPQTASPTPVQGTTRTAAPQGAPQPVGTQAPQAARQAARPSSQTPATARDHVSDGSNPNVKVKPRNYCLANGQSGFEVPGVVYMMTPAGYMVRAAGQPGECATDAASPAYAGTRSMPLWWLLVMLLVGLIGVILARHSNRFLFAQHRSEDAE